MTLDGADWIVWVQQLAAVPAGVLGPRVATLRESRDALLRAVDILTHGF